MRTTLALSLILLLAAFAQAQTPTAYDCQISATFTATSTTTAPYYNKGPVAPCVSWRLTYATLNATGVSIQLQGTNNLPNGNADPAGWTALTPQTGSTNPATGTSAGTIAACCDYYPWIRAIATSFTGTGQTMSLAVFGYKGTSASRQTEGTGTVTGGPFTAGNAIIGAGGQAIADSGSPPFANPMVAAGDMIDGGASGAPARLAGNTSTVPKALTATGDGVNAGTPQWSVITTNAALYYFSDTASDLSSTLQMIQATYSPKTTLNYALSVGTNNLQQWATNAGTPGATFAPAGVWAVHLHYSRSVAPIGTIYLQAQINEVSATGTFIATIGTTEQTPAINPQGGEQEDDLAYADSNPYTFASSTSRVQVIVQAISSSATPTVNLIVGGTADAHLAIPTSSGGGGVTTVTASLPLTASAGSSPNLALPFPATSVDISTPANPTAGSTSWYTKGGTWCSLSPAGVENCTGAGGGSGGPTTQAVVTGSRSFGVAYQNTNSTTMWVAAASECSSGTVCELNALTDTSNPPTTQVLYSEGVGGAFAAPSLTFLVLPGSWYVINIAGGSPTNSQWTEWH